MGQRIFQILDKLRSKNKVFKDNAFFYDTTIDFKSGGVSDRYENQFYIRRPFTGVRDFRYRKDEEIYFRDEDYVIVVQLSKEIDPVSALNTIEYQLHEIGDLQITSSSYDTEKIFTNETGKKANIRDFNLLHIEITVEQPHDPRYLKCKPIC